MFPEHAPFTPDQRRSLESLLAGLTLNQRSWLSGFLAGLPSASQPQSTAAPAQAPLTVLYGTESGNAETLAARAVKAAKNHGFKASLKNMSEFSVTDLQSLRNLLVVVSTWGDGEPPESAASFHKAFMTSSELLPNLRFSVCALGDTSYEKFCQTGKDFDHRLESLGATRVAPRQDCDVDFEDSFHAWLVPALKALAPADAPTQEISPPPGFAPATEVEYGKKHPFPSELLESVVLNGKGSAKETLHLEFSLAGSGMTYEPGDVIGVTPRNPPDVVEAVLAAAKLTGNEEISTKSSGTKLLRDALTSDLDITALSRNILTKLAEATGNASLQALLADDAKEALKSYLHGREIVDAIETFAPDGLPANTLASILRKLPPRLYSIASSPLAHPDEVHLTVAAVRYQTHGKSRKGVCSTYLADLVKPGDQVPLFVQPNKNFRLPADPETPIIMVGPGTGIAPFRAFIEHRVATNAPGKSWLFMGDQHYLFDFLYQLEWQDYLKSGALTKLDVAFSRDQPEKRYVQHLMLENAAELYSWLEQGAHFYVCGDARHMAVHVHEALVSIVSSQGNLSEESAEAYLDQLKKSHRYHRDVY